MNLRKKIVHCSFYCNSKIVRFFCRTLYNSFQPPLKRKKVKLSMFAPRRRKGGVVQLHSFLTSAVCGGQQLTPHPVALRLRNNIGTHRIRVWVPLQPVLRVGTTQNLLSLARFESQTVQSPTALTRCPYAVRPNIFSGSN